MVKKIGRIGTNFGISFLQIGASLKKARGSGRERLTFVCIIQIWNTSTCSSAPKLVEKSHVLRWISRSHARNENELQTSGRRGSAGKIEKLGFLNPVNPKHAWKSWNLAWCHDMAATCCGLFFSRIWTRFGTSFLQTGASLKKARGSEREHVTSVCETTYVHCLLPP